MFVVIAGEAVWLSKLFRWKMFVRASNPELDSTEIGIVGEPRYDKFKLDDCVLEPIVESPGMQAKEVSLLSYLTANKYTVFPLVMHGIVDMELSICCLMRKRGSVSNYISIKDFFNGNKLSQCEGQQWKFMWAHVAKWEKLATLMGGSRIAEWMIQRAHECSGNKKADTKSLDC